MCIRDRGWPGQGRGNGDSLAHSVVLTQGFYLGKYEVTQEQYKKITGKNPSFFKTAKHPVVNVSWNDAVSFCQALTKKESKQGWKFVLPTEAQWEYACRAGSTTSYSWGDEINPKRANYKGSGLEKAMRVGSYQANPWGFFDMHGNVWEWCRDWIGPYPKGLTVDPVGAGSGSSRVYRGGSWDRGDDRGGNTLKSIYRGRYSPKGKMKSVGFRVALKQVD